MPKLDVLAFGAHPDDVELCAGGTICTLTAGGYRVGVVDLTHGQLGTRGTPELRDEEARRASTIMELAVRENLHMMDGAIDNTRENQLRIVRVVRKYRPHVALIGALECRHPDHGAAARLCADAFFYAGLPKIDTKSEEGQPQEPWRPHHVLHYMQALTFEPTFVVDVSNVWGQRIEALKAFGSQFYNPDYEPADDEPETFVSNEGFFKWIEARARTYGYRIGAEFGEPLLYRHGPVGVKDLVAVLREEKPYR
jgi:bacillithiol biosynthesis deacetylase BshB1